MNWLASIGIGLCAAPATAIIVGTAAGLCADWLRIPQREGAAGYFIVGMGLLGALAGFVLGLLVARGAFGAPTGFGKSLGVTLGACLVVTLLVTGLVWLAADPPARSPAPPPAVEASETAEDAKHDAVPALAADAPLPQWLALTRYGAPRTRIEQAAAIIRARPRFVEEMTHELLHGEHTATRDALHVIEHIQPPRTELKDAVAAVGRHIAESIRQLELHPSEERLATYGTDVSTHFSAWMVAVRALQGKDGADFVPQLREIIEPARERQGSDALRTDVVRVASFYLHKWGGIAPLPTDPPPR